MEKEKMEQPKLSKNNTKSVEMAIAVTKIYESLLEEVIANILCSPTAACKAIEMAEQMIQDDPSFEQTYLSLCGGDRQKAILLKTNLHLYVQSRVKNNITKMTNQK